MRPVDVRSHIFGHLAVWPAHEGLYDDVLWDFKPENILIDVDGCIVPTDFRPSMEFPHAHHGSTTRSSSMTVCIVSIVSVHSSAR